MYKTGTCYICEEQRPVQSHHVAPLAYGGDQNGRQVPLCGTCHTTSHYEAEHYYKNGAYLYLDEQFPEGTRIGNNYRRIIKRIVQQRLSFEESGSKDNDQRRMSQVSWDSSEELAMAHDVKRAMGFTSLERAVKQCIFTMHQALQRKGKL